MIDAMKQALEALQDNRRSHYYCEDTWYSCPKHEDGCSNEAEADECNCGADKANEQIDLAITALRQAIEQAEKQEPVAWVRDLTSPQPHCVTSLKYLSIADTDAGVKYIPVYVAPPSKPWVSLSDRDITGAAHNEAKYPVSILETTDSGLCMQFSETGEWFVSDKRGDFMKVNNFLMSFARAIEAKLKEKNT